MSTERLAHRAWAIEEWARVLEASPDWASLKYPIGSRAGWMESRSDRGGPVYTTPGVGPNYGYHPGIGILDGWQTQGMFTHGRYCTGRLRRGKYLWSMVRAKIFREALVMYWWKVTVENGCAEGGCIRKRDREEFETSGVCV